MPYTYIRRAAIALALFGAAGCTVHSTDTPPLSGPSDLATSLQISATPDSVSQDGTSFSTVKIIVIGPDGKQPTQPVRLRLDMLVNGVPQDYGKLSERTPDTKER